MNFVKKSARVKQLEGCWKIRSHDVFLHLKSRPVGTACVHGDGASFETRDSSGQDDNPLPGHLKPLGSHRPSEGSIDVVDGFIEPEDFYEQYVRASRPIIFKGAASAIPAFESWTDEYLRDTYGTYKVDVEVGKKENRSQELLHLTLKDFLAVYDSRELYMVQDILPEMMGELILPRPLQCGGFQNILELGVIWFSSGGTKSVLHADGVDNINCLFDGHKSLIMIDKDQQDKVEAHGYEHQRAFSRVDIDSVDLMEFAEFQGVPWWSAEMEKGDCLFIPIGWYHTVESGLSRNLAVNLWFSHLLWFNHTDCEERTEKFDSLANYDIAGQKGSVEKIRSDAFSPFVDLSSITLTDMMDAWIDYADEDDIQNVFDDIDLDEDGEVSWEEVMTADILSLVLHYPRVLLDAPEEEIRQLQEEIQDEDDYVIIEDDEEFEYDHDEL
ncbi:hypothetical protein CAPTEDRAFT_211217 [Capitella teleta]|uniref:JmjC domain-containing protein n=1 Tax=Capitella teleta TaxID=283909 RepID=R7UYT7_CAPTE|nr:hypothetical protein CAPTEDRAFT_211217 [Capitella teleta]|eukprot:ELU08556.1 hypothetical protein CAPTEDRAFT_211217 [Capitella teleta]